LIWAWLIKSHDSSHHVIHHMTLAWLITWHDRWLRSVKSNDLMSKNTGGTPGLPQSHYRTALLSFGQTVRTRIFILGCRVRQGIGGLRCWLFCCSNHCVCLWQQLQNASTPDLNSLFYLSFWRLLTLLRLTSVDIVAGASAWWRWYFSIWYFTVRVDVTLVLVMLSTL